MPLDPIKLTQDLIRCPSVTPLEAGALDLIQNHLEQLGFTCERMIFHIEGSAYPVDNLYARLGTTSPNFCFAGHTDVVPVGDINSWTHDPFAAKIKDDILFGRGAVDMKVGIASFIAAVSRFLKDTPTPKGSISLLITNDEEADAINGTEQVLEVLAARGEKLDLCLLGEPTSTHKLGDTIKVGRRGSLSTVLTVKGKQCHAAYPERGENPLPRLLEILSKLNDRTFDEGTEFFQPTNLEITSIETSSNVTNVIPEYVTALFNIRFNTHHTPESLKGWITTCCEASGGEYTLSFGKAGNAFVDDKSPLKTLVKEAVKEVTGENAVFNTAGGTSDARFIYKTCPVIEFGVLSKTAHQVDEQVPIQHLADLTEIYHKILQKTFASL
ncbi:MAG: succinyl-diaminopimelate desuccinylase [Alphaproteobacteria bacterium]